jgi:hypothetical protein
VSRHIARMEKQKMHTNFGWETSWKNSNERLCFIKAGNLLSI